MSGQILQVQAGAASVALNKQFFDANARTIVSRREFNKIDPGAFTSTLTDLGPGILATAPVSLSTIAETDRVAATITPGFAGRLSAAFALVTTAASTAARTASFGVFIDQVPGTNEVQTLTITGTPTGGTFTLTYAGQTTATIAFNAAAAAVQSALEALSNIAVGDVVCAGGALPGTPVTITFGGSLAGADVAQITAASGGLTGGTTPTATVTTTTPGTAGTDGLSATATSGGAITLTSANVTPAGRILPFSRIVWSAANPMDFGATSVISFRTTAAPTAFAEGAVVFGVVLDSIPLVSVGNGPLLV
jgi:hypothetical protein